MQALILTPTREIALQTSAVVKELGKLYVYSISYVYFIFTYTSIFSFNFIMKRNIKLLHITKNSTFFIAGRHMDIQCIVTTGGTSLKDDILRLYTTTHVAV